MSVFALLGAVKNQLKLSSSKKADVSNNLLAASRFMGVLLLIFSILTTSKQFFGEPIVCKPSSGAIPKDMFTTHCFMNGTQTYLRMSERTEHLQHGEAHVGTVADLGFYKRKAVTHNYYQWIPFILFLQAVCFFLPYKLWKRCIGNRLENLVEKVTKNPLDVGKQNDENIEALAKFLAQKPGWFNGYAVKMFFIGDFGVLILAIVQMYLIDLVFDGQYFGLGHEFYTLRHAWEYYRILEEMFPLVTSCQFNWINTAGTPTIESGLCVMSINILNQKLFIISWLLHMILIGFAIVTILWEVLMMATPALREIMLRWRGPSISGRAFERVHKRTTYGQFILFTLLAQNMETEQFENLLILLADLPRDDFPSESGSSVMAMSAVLHPNYGGGKKDKENLLPTCIQDRTAMVRHRL